MISTTAFTAKSKATTSQSLITKVFSLTFTKSKYNSARAEIDRERVCSVLVFI